MVDVIDCGVDSGDITEQEIHICNCYWSWRNISKHEVNDVEKKLNTGVIQCKVKWIFKQKNTDGVNVGIYWLRMKNSQKMCFAVNIVNIFFFYKID